MYLGKFCEVAPSRPVRVACAPLHRVVARLDPVADPTVAGHGPPQGEPPSPVLPPSVAASTHAVPPPTNGAVLEEPKLRAIGTGHFVACHHPIHGDEIAVAAGQVNAEALS